MVQIHRLKLITFFYGNPTQTPQRETSQGYSKIIESRPFDERARTYTVEVEPCFCWIFVGFLSDWTFSEGVRQRGSEGSGFYVQGMNG